MRFRVVSAWLLVAVAVPTASPFAEPDAWIVIHADAPGPTFPAGLLGVAQPPTTDDVANDARGAPHVRVDVNFERAAPGPKERDWAAFDQSLARIHAMDAEPVVILDYMPAWLSTCPNGDAPTRCPPADTGTWAGLVREACERAAAAGAQWFEVWNEPDSPAFWRGTLADYLTLYQASVAGVEEASGTAGRTLRVGGPSVAVPDPVWIPALLAHARLRNLPVDFVSFHWYADYPLMGPLGDFPGTPVAEQPAPDPESFATWGSQVRAWADAAGFHDAEVWITEWNLNAGDSARMRGGFGAAFAAAAWHAAIRGGNVDRMNYFNLQHDVWGLFSDAGVARPAWNVLDTFTGWTGTVQVRESGGSGLGAQATKPDPNHLEAVVHRFDPLASARARVEILVPGWEGARVRVRDLVDGSLLADATLSEEGFVVEAPALAVWRLTAERPRA